jgi:hypothetical protein
VSAEDGQSVEPSTGLVETLCDKVTREAVLEVVLVLEGVVLGGIRHAARLKPTIEHLAHTTEFTLTLLAGDGNVVYLVTVKIGEFTGVATQLLKFLNAANGDNFAEVVADPQREGSSPETIPRNVPITSVLDPAGKSLFFDERWNPVGLLNAFQHLRNDGSDLHEP